MADWAKSYCAHVEGKEASDLHKAYHDYQYGFPIEDDNELFGRLILEINQAGLNWTTILKKQDNFRAAYDQFNIAKMAAYSEKDRERLLSDAGIIRNKLKVNAAIHNAQVVQELQAEHGSFKAWILKQGDHPIEDWVKIFRKKFKFVGGEIVNEFLMSAGFIPGAHHPDCPFYKKALVALNASSYRA